MSDELNTHKLTKIKSTHENLRTDEIIGFPYGGPTIGRSLVFISAGGGVEIKGADRVITTSNVKEIKELAPGKQELITENSTYVLERLNVA